MLHGLDISFPGVVHSDAPAVIASSHRTVLNGHFYWASSTAARAQFEAELHRYSGPVLDPVTHEWFLPDSGSPRRDLDGQILLFASEESLRQFEREGAVFRGHGH